MVLPMILEIVQRLQLLGAIGAEIDVRFTVVSQTVLFHTMKSLESFSTEAAGKSEEANDWNSLSADVQRFSPSNFAMR
jgi:hypothetical protein